MQVLTVTNLVKLFSYKPWYRLKAKPIITRAVNDISFAIKEGEIVGLLGPNGAGKTTTVHMLLGTLTPTSGEVYYFNRRFNPEHKEVLAKVNFSSAYINLPHRMTVKENLDVYARLYGVKNRSKRIKSLLSDFDSLSLENKRMNELSAGQKTRVLLIKAFINYPRLLLLDEPTASLDPEIAVRVRHFLLRQQKEYGVTMLFTSHNMHEVQEICDKIIFLHEGKILEQDTPSGLVRKMKKTKLNLVIVEGRDYLEKYLSSKKIPYQWHKSQIKINIKEDQVPKVLYRLSENGVRYSDIEIVRPNLEDYFLDKAGPLFQGRANEH